MPLYLCIADEGVIPNDTKEGISKAFTDIHCGLTFAPPSFVHVYFIESEGAEQSPPQISIVGNIRADRTEAVKDDIKQQMCRELATSAGLEPSQVSMTINESPGSWTMEGGHLLPEPGEEDAWMERHYAMIAEQGSG